MYLILYYRYIIRTFVTRLFMNYLGEGLYAIYILEL